MKMKFNPTSAPVTSAEAERRCGFIHTTKHNKVGRPSATRTKAKRAPHKKLRQLTPVFELAQTNSSLVSLGDPTPRFFGVPFTDKAIISHSPAINLREDGEVILTGENSVTVESLFREMELDDRYHRRRRVSRPSCWHSEEHKNAFGLQ